MAPAVGPSTKRGLQCGFVSSSRREIHYCQLLHVPFGRQSEGVALGFVAS